VWALNDCEYYLQLASGVEWVEPEAPKSSRTVTIGVSTWRLNNCHGWSQILNQVIMTFVDVKLEHHGSSLICTLDQILARPLAMAWPLSIKVTMFYYWTFVLLITITSSLNVYSTLQDVPGEQLGNDLQNCCSQVSSSVPDCTACKQVWAKFLRIASPFVCKYHFLHLSVSSLLYWFQTDEGYPSWRKQRCSSEILCETWLFSTCNLWKPGFHVTKI
jgi:hypothetical protein